MSMINSLCVRFYLSLSFFFFVILLFFDYTMILCVIFSIHLIYEFITFSFIETYNIFYMLFLFFNFPMAYRNRQFSYSISMHHTKQSFWINSRCVTKKKKKMMKESKEKAEWKKSDKGQWLRWNEIISEKIRTIIANDNVFNNSKLATLVLHQYASEVNIFFFSCVMCLIKSSSNFEFLMNDGERVVHETL